MMHSIRSCYLPAKEKEEADMLVGHYAYAPFPEKYLAILPLGLGASLNDFIHLAQTLSRLFELSSPGQRQILRDPLPVEETISQFFRPQKPKFSSSQNIVGLHGGLGWPGVCSCALSSNDAAPLKTLK
jgi:hypothetical protein